MPGRKETHLPQLVSAEESTARRRVVVVVGPTASGKSALAIALSQNLGAPIISADSRQVYRELDIGVARPSPAELASAPHHLVGYVSIQEPYSAGRWARDARTCLEACFGESTTAVKGQGEKELEGQLVPPATAPTATASLAERAPQSTTTCIIAGGSGLHVQALLEGLPDMPIVSLELKQHYDERLNTEGLPQLLRELIQRDPAYAAIVDRQNPMRIMRALAAMDASSSTFTALRERPREPLPYDVRWIILEPERELLYHNINQRVEHMLQRGLEHEVRSLSQHRHLAALQTIGYREWWPYIDGNTSFDATVTAIKNASRSYARRQLTWDRRLDAYHDSSFGLRQNLPNAADALAWLQSQT